MKKQCALFVALFLAFGNPLWSGSESAIGFTAVAQTGKVSGVVKDSNGEPLIGATVMVKGTNVGVSTDANGAFSIAAAGKTLVVSYVGHVAKEVKAANGLSVVLENSSTALDEVVVTALGIKKDKKSLGYAIDDLDSEELMKNKSANALSSLSGKIAGVNITQSSGAAGAGAQIILRGATSVSENRDSQPLFVVDGVIYDNSSTVGGNSGFDGSINSSTTTSNRVMDINPEDIENMSVLKGPAAAALYGSRAANGVVIITTKKGKAGTVEVNVNAKMVTSWVTNVPQAQTRYRRGYYEDELDADGNFVKSTYYDDSYNSWGRKYEEGEKIYGNNIDDFFQTGTIWDTNVSVAGGNKNGNFFLSGSHYNQGGVIPETKYVKNTFRFNGEQKWKIFTFGANASYSQARTNKTLTSGGLYGSSGDGALGRLYCFGTTDDMSHYMNEDGTRYRIFGDKIDPWNEYDNPYWIINKNNLTDETERFTGNFSVKADIADWWWVSYRMGIDSYTSDYHNRIAPGGVVKREWQRGMMSDNTRKYEYLTTNVMTNFNKQFGDFNLNLMLGTSTDKTDIKTTNRMAYNFQVDNVLAYGNAPEANKKFNYNISQKRLVSAFGEFRADWKNTVFLTVTGRNDWTSTLPIENRSYFYPSVSGAFVFSQLLQDLNVIDNDVFTFGKLRASWAKVGKDTSPYETNTSLWPVGTYLNGTIGLGNSWTRGNPGLKPETTVSTEYGIELRFFKNRLKLDYAYYTNDTYDQIISPRGAQSTGYIFCSVNVGNVLNKGMELSISGTPVETKDWTWETGINMAGNRGRLEGLPKGMDIMYLTDVQYGNAQAASYSPGAFMGISGSRWERNEDGKVIIGKDGMPKVESGTFCVGNREAKFTGGWNNTLTWKDLSLNMLWEFRVGGHVYNNTARTMMSAGTSEFSADVRDQALVIEGVVDSGQKDADGNIIWESYSATYNADDNYVINGVAKSGYNIIKDYYTGAYASETANYLTEVNSLRLRSLSLSYSLPKSLLAKQKVIKRASVQATATNILLFTNYDGDPEAAASGSGVGGSSSVGFESCGVPATAGFTFGVNLTF